MIFLNMYPLLHFKELGHNEGFKNQTYHECVSASRKETLRRTFNNHQLT